jgi:hypothetical protein
MSYMSFHTSRNEYYSLLVMNIIKEGVALRDQGN